MGRLSLLLKKAHPSHWTALPSNFIPQTFRPSQTARRVRDPHTLTHSTLNIHSVSISLVPTLCQELFQLLGIQSEQSQQTALPHERYITAGKTDNSNKHNRFNSA